MRKSRSEKANKVDWWRDGKLLPFQKRISSKIERREAKKQIKKILDELQY